MIEDKNRIIRLYLDGYKAVEIAYLINEKSRTIQRILREFKKDLTKEKVIIYENVHKNNRQLRCSENKENKKIMSDNTIAMRNPSAYTVNKQGDWVLIREKFNYTLDMPLIIKNVEGRKYKKTFVKKFYKMR